MTFDRNMGSMFQQVDSETLKFMKEDQLKIVGQLLENDRFQTLKTMNDEQRGKEIEEGLESQKVVMNLNDTAHIQQRNEARCGGFGDTEYLGVVNAVYHPND
jgi:hypothetical protein